MASPNDVPRVAEPIAGSGGFVTRAWLDFFLKLASTESQADLAALYAALAARVAELEDNEGFSFQIIGQGAVSVNGTPQPGGFVVISLDNDVDTPGNTMYYGTGPTGERGWFPVSGTMLVEAGQLTKTVGPNGVTTFGLAPLADTGVGTFRAITRDAYGRVEGSRQGTADDVPVAKLGSATYDTLQESINVLNSPGLVSGGVLSDAGGGNLAWTAGTVAIRATDSDVATLYMANFPSGTAAIPNDSTTRFVGVSYNAGTPAVVIKTADVWNYDTEFPIGEVANLGGTLFPFSNPFKVGDPITNIIQRFDAQAYAIRAASGGLLMSTDGTNRNLDLTAGIIWSRLNDFPIAARTSTTFPMYSVAPSGGTPPLIFTPGFTQWPNTQYLSGTTLTTMTNNRWANLWVFVNIGSGAWGFAYGTGEYNNSSAAAGEQVPAYLTQNFLRQNLLLGRILFEKNSTVPIIESAFTRVFSTQAVSDHNQLSGLQGGSLGQYYHLTSAQVTEVNSSVQSVTAGSGVSVNNANPRTPIVAVSRLSGTYAARPSAGSVPVGTIYVATDVKESYVSDGVSWSFIPGAGNELGYAETSSPTTTSSTVPIDIPGMVITPTVGTRPLLIQWGSNLRMIGAGTGVLSLVVNGSEVGRILYAGTSYQFLSRSFRLSGLSPGTTPTIKLQAYVTAATIEVYADPNDRTYLLASNL